MSPRFELTERLRADGFVETWRAHDALGNAPALFRRTILKGDTTADDRIGHLFDREAAFFARRNLPGFTPVLAHGIDGAAFLARPWYEERETDPERLLVEGVAALALLHGTGWMHLNLHSGNVFRSSLGLEIADPGRTRDWRRDGGMALPDPNPAPEQRSADRRRGPWTDVWRLAATVLAMGHPETDALRRALNEDPVRRFPDGAAFQAALSGEGRAKGVYALGALDEQLIRLNRFKYERRACPVCEGVLSEPHPLAKEMCPVCREGNVVKRGLDARLCPSCHGGVLKAVAAADPPAACPQCTVGRMKLKRGKAICDRCELVLTKEGHAWSDGEMTRTAAEWRSFSGRSETVLLCDACDVQFDLLPDGRRVQRAGETDLPDVLTPPESARLADFAPLNGGNACCQVCNAEYLSDPDALTLLAFSNDPFDFGATHLGRRLSRWFLSVEAVGLGDPNVKVVCETCGLAMSALNAGVAELRETDHSILSAHLGEARSLEDWHRMAQGLPPEAEKADFEKTVDAAMRRAYLAGELGFDRMTDVLWHGPGAIEGRPTSVIVTNGGIELRKGLRRTRIGLEAFWGGRADGDRLILLRSQGANLELEIAPRELPVALNSGKRQVRLEAKDLAARLARELAANNSSTP